MIVTASPLNPVFIRMNENIPGTIDLARSFHVSGDSKPDHNIGLTFVILSSTTQEASKLPTKISKCRLVEGVNWPLKRPQMLHFESNCIGAPMPSKPSYSIANEGLSCKCELYGSYLSLASSMILSFSVPSGEIPKKNLALVDVPDCDSFSLFYIRNGP